MTRRRTIWTSIAIVVAAGTAFGLVWFQPWKLVTNDTVNEALPVVAVSTPPDTPSAGAATATSGRSTPPGGPAATSTPTPAHGPLQDVLLARGTFISHEHPTRGTVSVVRRADGTRVLAIAGLHTSNGPLLKVWLTDQQVTESGWHVFDDGVHVNLGGLKGNIGNQLYPIPQSADLSVLRSVTIWCDRFDVSFGAAELVRVG